MRGKLTDVCIDASGIRNERPKFLVMRSRARHSLTLYFAHTFNSHVRSYLSTPFHVLMAAKKGSRTSTANAQNDEETNEDVLRQRVRLLEGRVQEREKEFEKSKQQMPSSSKLTR